MCKEFYNATQRFSSYQRKALALCASIAILLSSLILELKSARAQDVELQAAGALDASFGGGGKITTDFFGNTDEASCVAVQTDGKIIVAGEARSGSTDTVDFALVRYNRDGSLDTGFGTGGRVTTDFFQRAEDVAAIALQLDGKILVAGGASPSAGSTLFAIARYNTDGNLDAGFGSGGKVSLNVSAAPFDFASAVAVQQDGKIVVAGRATTGGANSEIVLARLNPDGSLDTSFSGDGLAEGPPLSAINTTSGAAIQADGKIVISGSTGPNSGSLDFLLARFNANGSLDTGFGNGGKVVTDFLGLSDTGRTVLVLLDGKLLLAGTAEVSQNNLNFALARYNSDGGLDASFGVGGKVTTAFPGGTAFILQAALHSDGRIVAAGGIRSNPNDSSTSDLALARYNADGSIDTGFGTNGRVTTDFSGLFDLALAVALQADGKIVVAGDTQKTLDDGMIDFAVARYRGAESTPFSLDLSKNDITASRGTKVKVDVIINRADDLTGNVTISRPESVQGINISPSDPITTTDQSMRFKLKIKASAPGGPHELTFTGVDERGETARVTLRLNVE
jgi:uncharacterized delta-60 repeat protein